MLILGVVALLGAGLLFHERRTRPLPSPAGMASGRLAERDLRRGDRVSMAFTGIATDLQTAAGLLDHERGGAAALLDAAFRVADVLRYAVPSPSSDDIYARIAAARRHLQNGDAAGAASAARAGAHAALSSSTRRDVQAPVEYVSYDGAEVIDFTGAHQGTVLSTTDRDVRIETPSWRNLLGFVDLAHGQVQTVDARDTLFGEPRHVGRTRIIVRAIEWDATSRGETQ